MAGISSFVSFFVLLTVAASQPTFNTFMTMGKMFGKTIKPVPYTLPSPPQLWGPLAPNMLLRTAEKVGRGVFRGPASIVQDGENLWVGTTDGKIYNAASCPPQLFVDMRPAGCKNKAQCGQLVSGRMDPVTGDLLVLDTVRGLYRINKQTKLPSLVFDARTVVDGRRPRHLNDFVVTNEGDIIISDSSDSFDFWDSHYIALEGREDGRLITVKPSTYPGVPAAATSLPLTFAFPNGLEWTDETRTTLLVAETGMSRIVSVNLDMVTSPHLYLDKRYFAVNLPGLPDNIRRSDHGTVWVGMAYARHTAVRNPGDKYANSPQWRSTGALMVSRKELENYFDKWGIAVELDIATGQILRSIQDPKNTAGNKGQQIPSVTEVSDYGGILNVGSTHTAFMGRILQGTYPSTPEGYMQLVKSRCVQMTPDEMSFRNRVYDAYMQMG